jgi:hypothetical protein
MSFDTETVYFTAEAAQAAHDVANLATLAAVKSAEPVNITNNAVARVALAEFKRLKELESAGEAAKKARTADGGPEAILREVLGDAEALIVLGNVVAKLQHSKNSRVDTADLKEAFPEAWAATYKSTPYSFIKTL